MKKVKNLSLGVVPIRKGGKKGKSKTANSSSDSIDNLPEKFPEQAELPEMETVANPKLEEKGRQIANRRDRIKKLQEEEKGLVADALVIMHDHEIKIYNKHGVILRIKESEKLDVEID